jgi:hypothetical protein
MLVNRGSSSGIVKLLVVGFELPYRVCTTEDHEFTRSCTIILVDVETRAKSRYQSPQGSCCSSVDTYDDMIGFTSKCCAWACFWICVPGGNSRLPCEKQRPFMIHRLLIATNRVRERTRFPVTTVATRTTWHKERTGFDCWYFTMSCKVYFHPSINDCFLL